LVSQIGHLRLQAFNVESIEHGVERLNKIVAHIGDCAAECTGHTGEPGNQSAFQADFFDQSTGMQCAAAAEGHGCEFIGIVATFDGNETNGPGHA